MGTQAGGLEFTRLSEVAPNELIALMNLPGVRKHLPLARGEFGPSECAAFVAAKEAMWDEHGYGPWAFVIDGAFAGWGGLQPEGDDADLALILHPAFWGHGKAIYDQVIARAFGELGLTAVTILLPPSRGRAHAVQRLGFSPDGETTIHGERFLRYRLRRPTITGAWQP
jgi:ribosomal-protein-alanine N-acetyltransferase